MPEEMQPHVLVVTSDDGDLSYSIECPGVSRVNRCVRYSPCKACTPEEITAMLSAADLDEDQPEGVAHGVDHLMFEGEFWALDGLCFAAEHDHLADTADYIGANRPGRYRVYVSCESEYELVLDPVDRVGSAVAPVGEQPAGGAE